MENIHLAWGVFRESFFMRGTPGILEVKDNGNDGTVFNRRGPVYGRLRGGGVQGPGPAEGQPGADGLGGAVVWRLPGADAPGGLLCGGAV